MSPPRSLKLTLLAFLAGVTAALLGTVWAVPTAFAADSPDGLWREVLADEALPQAFAAPATPADAAARGRLPAGARSLWLDLAALEDRLDQVPVTAWEAAAEAVDHRPAIDLPLPEGGYRRFLLVELQGADAAPKTGTRAFHGEAVDDPAVTARCVRTALGFFAVFRSPAGTVYVDPEQPGSSPGAGGRQLSVVYRRGDVTPPPVPFSEPAPVRPPPPGAAQPPPAAAARLGPPSGPTALRIYRLAVAATGEYTRFHGGRAQAMAAIEVAVERMSEILEREAAIRLELVPENRRVVFEDPDSDPFTHGDPEALLAENQRLLDDVIGASGYDLGHVFDTAGGGLADLGVACLAGYKAHGMSGLERPAGDPFVVAYALHELGHQLGAEHSFNGTSDGCAGNRHAATAFEPGSGSTVMAYAGLCHPENLQDSSDDYFHSASLDQIRDYAAFGTGGRCGRRVETANGAPRVDAGRGHVLPALTPFELVGSASDPDGDALDFTWEQLDLGRASPPNGDGGGRPIFRSLPPVADASTPPGSVLARSFPRLEALLAGGGGSPGEVLPCAERSLTFRLTVRDNRWPAGGVASDSVRLVVAERAGPFRVLYPGAGTVWRAGRRALVRWDTAATDRPPVDCRSVDILLSVDGGTTYPTLLDGATANDGQQRIVVPALATASGRVKVRCAENAFFALSAGDFEIR